jgi:hypothetical protein
VGKIVGHLTVHSHSTYKTTCTPLPVILKMA